MKAEILIQLKGGKKQGKELRAASMTLGPHLADGSPTLLVWVPPPAESAGHGALPHSNGEQYALSAEDIAAITFREVE